MKHKQMLAYGVFLLSWALLLILILLKLNNSQNLLWIFPLFLFLFTCYYLLKNHNNPNSNAYVPSKEILEKFAKNKGFLKKEDPSEHLSLMNRAWPYKSQSELRIEDLFSQDKTSYFHLIHRSPKGDFNIDFNIIFYNLIFMTKLSRNFQEMFLLANDFSEGPLNFEWPTWKTESNQFNQKYLLYAHDQKPLLEIVNPVLMNLLLEQKSFYNVIIKEDKLIIFKLTGKCEPQYLEDMWVLSKEISRKLETMTSGGVNFTAFFSNEP